MGGPTCTQTTVILILKIFEKIGAVLVTVFVESKYFIPLTPSASCHSSPAHQLHIKRVTACAMLVPFILALHLVQRKHYHA